MGMEYMHTVQREAGGGGGRLGFLRLHVVTLMGCKQNKFNN